jgi:hypothetical protein
LDFGLKTNHLATLRTSQTKQVKPILWSLTATRSRNFGYFVN